VSGWWEGRPRPDSDRDREVAPTGLAPWPPTGGRAVLGPILGLGPFWATTPWMGITSLIRANANLV